MATRTDAVELDTKHLFAFGTPTEHIEWELLPRTDGSTNFRYRFKYQSLDEKAGRDACAREVICHTIELSEASTITAHSNGINVTENCFEAGTHLLPLCDYFSKELADGITVEATSPAKVVTACIPATRGPRDRKLAPALRDTNMRPVMIDIMTVVPPGGGRCYTLPLYLQTVTVKAPTLARARLFLVPGLLGTFDPELKIKIGELAAKGGEARFSLAAPIRRSDISDLLIELDYDGEEPSQAEVICTSLNYVHWDDHGQLVRAYQS